MLFSNTRKLTRTSPRIIKTTSSHQLLTNKYHIVYYTTHPIYTRSSVYRSSRRAHIYIYIRANIALGAHLPLNYENTRSKDSRHPGRFFSLQAYVYTHPSLPLSLSLFSTLYCAYKRRARVDNIDSARLPFSVRGGFASDTRAQAIHTLL